jgi:hypothetical protein
MGVPTDGTQCGTTAIVPNYVSEISRFQKIARGCPCDEIAEPRADVELRSKRASRLHVDDDADRSPANLGRSIRLKSNFGADAEVHDPTIPCRA